MKPHSDHTRVPRSVKQVIEAIVDGRTARERASALLQGIQRTGWAGAAALWRRESVGGTWRPILWRGPLGDLPSAAQVEAVADGMLNADIPLGKRVVFPTFKYEEARLVALGLGQLGESEACSEWLESLFDTWSSLEPELTETEAVLESTLLDDMAGLLPHAEIDFETLAETLNEFLADDFTGEEIQELWSQVESPNNGLGDA